MKITRQPTGSQPHTATTLAVNSIGNCTHAVAANLTYDGVEGRWKALQASGLYERRAYLTEVYRNALAREVRGLGYEIDARRDSKGKDHGFEIRGVSNELLEKFSVRSTQRDAAIERFTVEHGRKPTDNEVTVLVRESRADKLAEIVTEKVKEQQQARLAPNERHMLQHRRSDSRCILLAFFKKRLVRQNPFNLQRNISLSAILLCVITN
jgi:conjugative relaxase-like TrwC/TraI family protein